MCTNILCYYYMMKCLCLVGCTKICGSGVAPCEQYLWQYIVGGVVSGVSRSALVDDGDTPLFCVWIFTDVRSGTYAQPNTRQVVACIKLINVSCDCLVVNAHDIIPSAKQY